MYQYASKSVILEHASTIYHLFYEIHRRLLYLCNTSSIQQFYFCVASAYIYTTNKLPFEIPS